MQDGQNYIFFVEINVLGFFFGEQIVLLFFLEERVGLCPVRLQVLLLCPPEEAKLPWIHQPVVG